ncbi:hypothetical protein ACLB2K_068098 [Fragaria x ananassa]
MYLSEKPHPIDFYKSSSSPDRDIMMDVVSAAAAANTSSGGEDHEVRAPKKRAETWIQEETRSLISFRREVDGLFNTSKSNKHLWEQISAKMRDKGFDRSPTMCTDKWRNLLKEFKKARHQAKVGSRSAKMTYYEDLQELLRGRTSSHNSNSGANNAAASNGAAGGSYKRPNSPPKLESFIRFSDKSLEDAGIPFGPMEAAERTAVDLERQLDHDGDPLAITTGDAVAGNEVPPWNWREGPENGGEGHSSYCGRIITVKLGEYNTRRIGIDGTADAIKEAIKSAFRIRTKRSFWLEDEYQVVRSLDRDMPLGNYTLHLDEGVTIKLCLCDESDHIVRTEEITFYTEDDFRDFLTRRGLIGLRDLRELGGYRRIDTLEDLQSGAMYQGVRLMGD